MCNCWYTRFFFWEENISDSQVCKVRGFSVTWQAAYYFFTPVERDKRKDTTYNVIIISTFSETINAINKL